VVSVLEELYRLKQRDFSEKLRDMVDPRVVYVTDLVSCSHKRVLRQRYPLLSFRFEPPLVLGDLVHAGLESILAGGGEGGDARWRSEVEVSRSFRIDGEEYVLKGRADLVLYEDDRPLAVVEIKTARDLPENEPHPHHVGQLRVYMELLGAEEGLLVYITPERLVEFPVERAPVDLERMMRETLEDAARPRYDWECRYCPFRKLCPYALQRR